MRRLVQPEADTGAEPERERDDISGRSGDGRELGGHCRGGGRTNARREAIAAKLLTAPRDIVRVSSPRLRETAPGTAPAGASRAARTNQSTSCRGASRSARR